MQQQHEKIRKKRDYNTDFLFYQKYGTLRQVAPETRIQYRDAGLHAYFPDPLFKEQWYLVSRVCVFVLKCFFYIFLLFAFYFISTVNLLYLI